MPNVSTARRRSRCCVSRPDTKKSKIPFRHRNNDCTPSFASPVTRESNMAEYRTDDGTTVERRGGAGRTIGIILLVAAVIVAILFATGFWSADVKEGALPDVEGQRRRRQAARRRRQFEGSRRRHQVDHGRRAEGQDREGGNLRPGDRRERRQEVSERFSFRRGRSGNGAPFFVVRCARQVRRIFSIFLPLASSSISLSR